MDQPARQRRREQLRLAQRRSRQRRQTAMDDLLKENGDLKKQVQELNGLVADLYGLCKDRISRCQDPSRETLQRVLETSSPMPDVLHAGAFGSLSSLSSPYGPSLDQDDEQPTPTRGHGSSPEAEYLNPVEEVDLDNEEWHNSLNEPLLHDTSIENTPLDLGVDSSLLTTEFQYMEQTSFLDEQPFAQVLPNFDTQEFNTSVPKELSIRSLAHTELTLGRHIHRRCIEHVHTLMTLPRIDPRIWTRIFGNELSRPPGPTRDLVVSGLERRFQQGNFQYCRFPEPVLWSRQSQDVARRNRTDVLTPGGVEQLCQNMGLLVLETAPSASLEVSGTSSAQASNRPSLNATSSDPSPTFWMPGTGLGFNPKRDEEQPAPGKKHVVRPVFAGRGAKKLDIDAFVNYLLEVGFCGVYSPVFYLADVYRAIVKNMVNI